MLKRNKKTGLGSEAVWNYAYNIIEENMRNGNIIRDVEE
jgi:hypothetical protein